VPLSDRICCSSFQGDRLWCGEMVQGIRDGGGLVEAADDDGLRSGQPQSFPRERQRSVLTSHGFESATDNVGNAVVAVWVVFGRVTVVSWRGHGYRFG